MFERSVSQSVSQSVSLHSVTHSLTHSLTKTLSWLLCLFGKLYLNCLNFCSIIVSTYYKLNSFHQNVLIYHEHNDILLVY